jgi:elongation factor Tu
MSEEPVVPTSSPKTSDAPFLMEIANTFVLRDRGIVASGKIRRGKVRVGDEVEVVGFRPTPLRSTVAGVEMIDFAKIEDWLRWHEQGIVGLLLRGLTASDVQRGQVLATPGAIRPYSTFLADVTFSKQRGAIRQQPTEGAYPTAFHIWSGTVPGILWIPLDKTRIVPGDQFDATIELSSPVALEIGREFEIGDAVGKGVVTDLGE